MAVLQSSYLPAQPTDVCAGWWWKRVSISSEIVAELSMPGLLDLDGLAVRFTREYILCLSVQWHGKWWRQIFSWWESRLIFEISFEIKWRTPSCEVMKGVVMRYECVVWSSFIFSKIIIFLWNMTICDYYYFYKISWLRENTHEFMYVLKKLKFYFMYTHKFQYVFLKFS